MRARMASARPVGGPGAGAVTTEAPEATAERPLTAAHLDTTRHSHPPPRQRVRALAGRTRGRGLSSPVRSSSELYRHATTGANASNPSPLRRAGTTPPGRSATFPCAITSHHCHVFPRTSCARQDGLKPDASWPRPSRPVLSIHPTVGSGAPPSGPSSNTGVQYRGRALVARLPELRGRGREARATRVRWPD